MLHLEIRELIVPQRIAGNRVTLTLTFRNRLRNTIDCEFSHSGTLRRRQTSSSSCTVYPSEVSTTVPWMSYLNHELTATIEISYECTILYETAIRVAPLKVKHILSGDRVIIELPMDKISCSIVCVCKDMSQKCFKILIQNMSLKSILPLFPEPITDCYLVIDAGYTIKQSIYNSDTKSVVEKCPISLVSKPQRVSVFIQGSIGDAIWESMVYNGEIDIKTRELIMYELINVLDILAIFTLSTFYKSIASKTKTNQSKEIRSDRSFTRKERRQHEKDYKLLLNACIMEGIIKVTGRNVSLSRICGPSVIEALATIKGLPHENINPLHLLSSYSTNNDWQHTLTRLKILMSGCFDKWVVAKRVRNWISTIDHKYLLAGLLQNYISPTHLTVPERIGKSQLHDILCDCDDDNVCYVLNILCRDAMTLPKISIGDSTYFVSTSNESLSPHKWLQTSDGSINSIHKFCFHYDIPQKSVCNFLWERLCLSDPSSNMIDPTAEMVMNKLSLLLTTALDTGTVGKWRNGLGKKYTVRSLFIDILIYIVTSVGILPLDMFYGKDVDGLGMKISHFDESEESVLCVDPLEEIKQLEQVILEEDDCSKLLVFSRHVQQCTNDINDNSQLNPLPKQSTSYTHGVKSRYEVHEYNPSASQSLCAQGETLMLQTLSSEVSLSIADLAIESKNEDYEANNPTNHIQQVQLPAVPRHNGGVRKVSREPQAVLPLANDTQLTSYVTSTIFSDVFYPEEDVILSTIDRTRSTTRGSGIKTVVNPSLNQSVKSLSSSPISLSRLNTPNSLLSTTILPVHSNIFIDLIKLVRQDRTLTANQETLDQYAEQLIEAVVIPTNQFSVSAWKREQMNSVLDMCVAAAHLRHAMINFSSCVENVDKEQVKFLIMNTLSDNELEHLLLSFDEPLLHLSHKSLNSTKETQTTNSSSLKSFGKFLYEEPLEYSLLREKMLENDKIIDSILNKAAKYASYLPSNRSIINTTPTSSVQRSTETLLSINTGFARSSSKDTNYLFESNYESRAGTPDICQMLESVGAETCDQESTIWNNAIHSCEYEGLMLM